MVFSDLICQILVKCDGQFCSGDFAVWEAPTSLKRCIDVILRIERKQSYCENLESVLAKLSLKYLQSYLEMFIRHLAAAMPLLKTDNISRVCRYIIEIWPVRSCSDELHLKNSRSACSVLGVWDKISIFHNFHLGQFPCQTEHHSVRGDDPLCAPHRALFSFIECHAT